MSYLADLTLKVILVPLFAQITEFTDTKEMMKIVNQALYNKRIVVPKAIPQLLNTSFGQLYQRVAQVIRAIINQVDYDEIPQLRYIEPKYTNIIEGPSPKCISGLLYGNTLNIELTSTLISLCDTCIGPLEMLSCTIVLLPSGCRLQPHGSEYCGVLTYILVIDGSQLVHMKVGKQKMTLTSAASLLYDPIQETSFENTGPSICVLLKIELYRPFDFGFDSVNWSALQVLSESHDVQQACNLANMSV